MTKGIISNFAALLLASLVSLSAATPQRPNFVFILGEGHGWSSTSVQMDDTVPMSKSSFVRTPNLEKLAAGGVRFANFYAPSPRCTPSRVAMFAGKSPAQLHMTFINEGKRDSGDNPNGRVLTPSASMELPTSETTLAEVLKRAGYATAHFGKWHMGRANPREHGFDENDGANGNGGPDNVANPHPKQLYAMTERGLDFMARQVKAGKPFYLQLSHYASRQGGDASAQALATVKSWGGNLNERQIAEAAATLDLDIAFGQVLRKLDELGISTNTYVIFTTDHGTPGRNPPLAGGKGTVSEGGLRVPFIIRGPGIQAGACSHVRVIGADLFPSIAALAHVTEPLSKGVEGGSFASVLASAGSGAIKRPREEFVVHFPHYDKDAVGPASAIYLGDFKLVRVYETGALRLYDLSKDMREQQDLSKQMPDKVAEMDRRLSDYLKSVNAQMPTLKPSKETALESRSGVSAERRENLEPSQEVRHSTETPLRSQFTFTITADSHLDDHTDLAVYQRTLAIAAADKPAFHIDLGDTFMTEKHATREAAAKQYLDQRRYFDLLRVPVHLVVGNHDGESGRFLDGTTNNLAVWSRSMRLRYFPEPLAAEGRNYYSWQHSNALFVVLDPYWNTPRLRRDDDNWKCTLGAEQYRWLQRTLESSHTMFKFIFIHQLVGGVDRQGRGGVEVAPFFEWGGKNLDGTDGFKQHRPDWPMSIHQLLVQHRVNIVFHGHDHLYAKQDLDGIVYQEVPQPGDPKGSTRSAAEYGYKSGVLLGSPGYLRVAVFENQAKVEYVRPDRSIAHTYTVSSPAKP